MTAPLLSIIVPTLDRADRHEFAYKIFASQDYPEKEMLVLDESKDPSPFFSGLGDPRVRYWHEPMERGDVTKIGTTRNKLIERARGVFVMHGDDDDWYHSSWASTLLSRLGVADLVKSVVWRCLVESEGTMWEWDTRSMGGTHYALKGDTTPTAVQVDPEEAPMLADAYLDGFGWSYVYRRDLAQQFPFPAEGTEDYPWVRTCREHGANVVHLADVSPLAVHTVHAKSGSILFPQRSLGAFRGGLGAATLSLRDMARWRMLGAVGTMTELPEGKKIAIVPGVTYSVLASVDDKHTLKALTTRAESWGLSITQARDNVDASEFGVKPAPKGQRLVHTVGKATRAATMPWKVPKFVLTDHTTVVKAWSDQAAPTQINAQLQPASAGVGRPRELHGFGGGRCATCVNYAWTPEMGSSVKAIDGTMHHPSCSALDGLAASKMERMYQRMQDRRGLGHRATTLGPRGVHQINAQLTPR